MPRLTRFLGKKRGERSTGSQAVGRAALALFSAIFFAVGVIALVFLLLSLAVPEWRAQHDFVETKCRIIDTNLGPDGALPRRADITVRYTANDLRMTSVSHYDITGRYQADPQRLRKILESFEIGSEHPCWYDPSHPEVVVLTRGYTAFAWLILLVPAAFIAVGGGGLIVALLTWGKSNERIAAAGQRPAGLDFFMPLTAADPYPFVPDTSDFDDSPGTHLALRLTPATGRWRTALIALVCLLWNAAVAVFAQMAVNSFRRGTPDWLMTVFVVLLAAVGVGLILLLARELLLGASVGTTYVEISAHPLWPGRSYETFLSQSGRLQVKKIELALVCEETAIYRQGTNTRRACRRVYEQPLLSARDVEANEGQPFETRCSLQVPPGAMHSFHGRHNHIDWKLVVRCTTTRRPAFERSFPVIVMPAPAEARDA